MNSTDIDLWCHRRRIARELRQQMVSLDYPITLEISRYDPATNADWFVGEFSVIAHLEEGIGRGWHLEGFSYQASKFSNEPPRYETKRAVIRANGTRPVDLFLEKEISVHLSRHRLHVDEVWDEAWAKQHPRHSVAAERYEERA